ncbi:phospholipase D family protein [Roseovarius spongiae]|uniref:Phospholipase D n=1 Tax=Roseovarius spongiae TaxID=2320272 RepID=A0A3A8B9G2_9RHOB|nr:phospholipase D family protein [Roseovarius spongiae]RKF14793.1 phospholipase D family protein [Roseovarius spongiae]
MVTALKILVAAIAVLALVIIAARQIFAIPPHDGRVDSKALPPPDNSPLVRSAARQHARHAGKTGVATLGSGTDAFAARMILADAAVSSIDAQYYIWHGDLTGALLLDALRRAAERGVRVRLLLDDNGTSGLDAELAALDAHENAEVRLYNPFNLRRPKLLSYWFDFFRLNRRMHNKSFTVDGAVSILGGRNIGDEYFETGPTALYVDLDVLAVGNVVPRIAADFDRYWAAQAVHPVGPILGPPPVGDPIGDAVARHRDTPQLAEYREGIIASDIVQALRQATLDLEWSDVLLVSDDPVKGQGAVPREKLLLTRLVQAVGRIETRFDGVTPYFVPGAGGVRAFAGLEEQGIDVRILTNSLEATDVLPVHAGYAKRRRDLLRAGVEMFELQSRAAIGTPKEKIGPFGSSGASLHAKTFAVDGKRIFIGSFNFDPRSATINTEMGLLIDSANMADQMHDAFDRQLDGLAWQVLEQDGRLVWRDGAAGVTTDREPGTTALKRAALTVIGWLPLEWLL